jgi:hypothetical protein
VRALHIDTQPRKDEEVMAPASSGKRIAVIIDFEFPG